ncbi:MAG: hypothetical protein LBS54_06375 [Dysgonamonadaceae bacterium]|jgi:hypothetical protein|nr:hypothetical protein [Dysgonamonadaceae bacterium]
MNEQPNFNSESKSGLLSEAKNFALGMKAFADYSKTFSEKAQIFAGGNRTTYHDAVLFSHEVKDLSHSSRVFAQYARNFAGDVRGFSFRTAAIFERAATTLTFAGETLEQALYSISEENDDIGYTEESLICAGETLQSVGAIIINTGNILAENEQAVMYAGKTLRSKEVTAAGNLHERRIGDDITLDDTGIPANAAEILSQVIENLVTSGDTIIGAGNTLIGAAEILRRLI